MLYSDEYGEREDEDMGKDMKVALAVFLASVALLVSALVFTDLAADYEERNCATSGRYTFCDPR